MSETTNIDNTAHASVTVESGSLSGFNTPKGTRSFLGIPYAAPPVEELRWRPPQRPLAWTGVRSAEKFGPSSIQSPPPSRSLYGGGITDFSEDCLYLNVYTGPEGAEALPVLVWFHFGAFLFGSASDPLCDGTNLAAEGVTVVTVNYRLGRFGFLAHAELSAESGHQSSGNYGIMDQIAALEWIQRNIQAFGGDAKNVTIGGVSAGGESVHILRSSPRAKSLFTKAICESGPGMAPPIDGPGHVAAYMSLHAAEKAGAELLQSVGAGSIAELRKMPAEKIAGAQLPREKGPWKSRLWPGTASLSIFDTVNPIVDGYVLPESPLTAFMSSKVADVPLLAGNVVNEGTALPYLSSLGQYDAHVNEAFTEHTDEVRRLYPATTDSEVEAITINLLEDQVFIWPTWTAARLQAKNLRSPAWYSKFTRIPPIPHDAGAVEKSWAGSFHCANAVYAFGNIDVWRWDWTQADRGLSRDMLEAYVHFVRIGDPNGIDQDHDGIWPALESSSGLIKIWDVDPRLEEPSSRSSDVSTFWDSYYGVE
ncbi:alpha/beta-hydrolase [Xylariaceae sp. FL0016]|nr:alpha/beta-hydrolase [Xylariaceae sp. FL0016]